MTGQRPSRLSLPTTKQLGGIRMLQNEISWLGSNIDLIRPAVRPNKRITSRMTNFVVNSVHHHTEDSTVAKYFSRVQNGSDIRGIALDCERNRADVHSAYK
jgi:hypothetical protein